MKTEVKNLLTGAWAMLMYAEDRLEKEIAPLHVTSEAYRIGRIHADYVKTSRKHLEERLEAMKLL